MIWAAASLLVGATAYAGVQMYRHEPATPVNLMAVDVTGDALSPVVLSRTNIEKTIKPIAAKPSVKETAIAPQIVAKAPPVAAKADTAKPAVKQAPAAPLRPMYNHRPLKVVRTMKMVVTAYSPDARSCGKSADGITASGYSVWTNGMKMVAADTRILPFGSVIAIPGYDGGRPVPVLDRGGAIKGNRLDLLFPTHEQAMKFGRKTLTVTIYGYAD